MSENPNVINVSKTKTNKKRQHFSIKLYSTERNYIVEMHNYINTYHFNVEKLHDYTNALFRIEMLMSSWEFS